MAPAQRNRSLARHGAAGYIPIPALLLLYLAVAVAWGIPDWIAWYYMAVSLLCFAVYAADKSAAMTGRWRVSESTLLFLGLLGGWPGAIVAQQALRHKSSKAPFLAAFWVTVALNVLAFVLLWTPVLTVLRR